LAKKNKHIIALTADLAESVKTNYLQEVFPERHLDCGVAEQHLVSCSGGLSLNGFLPFCSTFGAFMTSRAKDQARVNDINQTNVKMVATHCGLSVGEDGPTHQAIDDNGSMLGLFNTEQMEPADPNHCDRLIRYAASHYGNMYVRMGRHKLPVLTKSNGDIFFDKNYAYAYGKCDTLRFGEDITIAAMGGTVIEALRAFESLKARGIKAEIIIVSSIKQFDETLFNSIKKTKRVLTVEDHNTLSGLGGQLARQLTMRNIHPDIYHMIGVKAYQLSGTAKDLYRAAEIDATAIEACVVEMIMKTPRKNNLLSIIKK
jgi:transketolase